MAYFETYPILLMEGPKRFFFFWKNTENGDPKEVEHFGPKHILIKCLPNLRIFSNSWLGPKKNERSHMLLEKAGT